MQESEKERYRSLLSKYKAKVEENLGEKPSETQKITSMEYQQFKQAFMPAHMSLYEKLCNFSQKLLKIKPSGKKSEELQEVISICHLGTSPAGIVAFSILGPFFVALMFSLITFIMFQAFVFIVFSMVLATVVWYILSRYPYFLANGWRLKASNQMVLCIFYVVTYMRHTSNLELAIEFASDHLSPPLSLDLKKILWDLETQKYESVKESLDIYLDTWKKWNIEFIESFHLIESSLYENSEARRLSSLDKALDVILEETYEKMLHFAHNLKSPITMLHMLGVILPILGLVILPLVVSFLGSDRPAVTIGVIATIYIVILPIIVFYMGKNILSTRPTGYGDTDISEMNPELKKYKNFMLKLGPFEFGIKPLHLSIIIGAVLLLIGFMPLLMHAFGAGDAGVGPEDSLTTCGKRYCLLEYREDAKTGVSLGPFGIGSSILSLAVTIGLGLAIGIYYKSKSMNIIKIREQSKQLELEFASALFQLGNRLGDGIPTETAVGKIAEGMEGTVSGKFFELVSSNIRRMGMSVNDAIFDKKYGALVHYPSNVIESSMKVLTESIKKGPTIAAQALMNVARYIKEIHKVNERLKDLMADIVSSMTSQIKFLTPVIAGIVIGITAMITGILGKLGRQLGSIQTEGTTSGLMGAGLFGMGVPTYYFQIIVGVYVVQIVWLLTILANGIENGADKLAEGYNVGINVTRSTLLYSGISFVVMALFTIIAGQILANTIS